MSYRRAVAALDARTNYERSGRLTSPTLERMRTLMEMMAEPQRSYAVVQITGTNGKTTVARACTEVLRAAGLAVGTYTSPHVESVRERIAYDGALIDEDAFAEAWGEVAPYLELADSKMDRPVTYFEALTALAFSWFAERAVDVAVVEVGMGGTWDATNVADAAVAVVTRVGLDHVGVLGNTPVEIAREKAGIVKPGSVLFSARQDDDVAAVLRARCDEVGAEIRAEGMAFEVERAALAVGGQAIAFRLERDRYPSVFLPIFGAHIAADAVLGAAAARAMLGGATVAEDVLTEAFANVRVPGRMEVMRRHPLVVLDGAHNPAAAEALAAALAASFTWERLVAVVSVLDDKNVEAVVAPIVELASEVIVTRADSPRAASLERMAAAARAAGAEPTIEPSVADAVARAISSAREHDCVLVTGSLYTVGEARPHARSSPIPKELG